LSWRKNGRDTPLNATSTKLLWNSPTSITISNVVLEDAGDYQCETKTGILSEKIKVEVMVQNKLVKMSSDRSEYVEGMEVVFSVFYEVNEHEDCTAEVYFRDAKVQGDGVSGERIKMLQIDSSSRYTTPGIRNAKYNRRTTRIRIIFNIRFRGSNSNFKQIFAKIPSYHTVQGLGFRATCIPLTLNH
jgi:hypothetical protein